MRKLIVLPLVLLCVHVSLYTQSGPTRGWLTIERIMRDPQWMGTSPGNVFWSEEGKWVYFEWRREGDKGDSLYVVSARGGIPRRVTVSERKKLPSRIGDYNRDWKKKVYARDGDVILLDIRRGTETQLTRTVSPESNPRFTLDEKKIVFERDGNLFVRHLETGLENQVTNLARGSRPSEERRTDLQKYVADEALRLFGVLRQRKEEKEQRHKYQEGLERKHPKPYYLGTKNATNLRLSPDERFATFVLSQQAGDAKRTIVPSYVTESGFTEDINARTKVGEPVTTYDFCVYDVKLDSVRLVKIDSVPGVVAAGEVSDTSKAKPKPRGVAYAGPYWSDDGTSAFVQLFSQDNKDRWLLILDPEKARLTTLLDRQTDSAWVGGPGIGFFGGNTVGWMPVRTLSAGSDSRRIYFQSEADGWSHLYTVTADGKERKQITKGRFEVYGPTISRDKKRWYFSSNEVHFGERHFSMMPLEGGTRTRITEAEGRNDTFVSPGEDRLAVLHSFSNRMPELFLKDNAAGVKEIQVTDSPSKEFRAYDWRAPVVLTFRARDGADIPARLYKPEKPNGAAIVFVHGAGYLQNAHKWWSTYFREYMFHNLLADKGYTVLDIDYRGSAGLGRDWRTAIYRHMGGKDLDDQVDGARWLVEQQGIDPGRIGIYGGSYGGFITFMAMFTTPGVFACGAALRPVSDWAHYNHGYTSAILNIPQDDSIAYRRSSPVYHAEGLKGALLICHGMVDVNVHFQDAVRVVQRLIELKKENWELAVYPVEDHGFREETSWMDEYKRILKLFDGNLLGK